MAYVENNVINEEHYLTGAKKNETHTQQICHMPYKFISNRWRGENMLCHYAIFIPL